jgi:hypothetical protein
MNILLPSGLITDTTRHREVRLRPMSSAGVLAASVHADPLQAILTMLPHAIERIGPLSGAAVDGQLLSGLVPLDLDFLCIQVARLTGETCVLMTRCDACGEAMDLSVDLATIPPGEAPAHTTLRLSLPSGREARFRLPCVGDMQALSDISGADADRTLVSRCCQEELPSLSAEVLRSLAATLQRSTPRIDTTVDLTCLECGGSLQFTLDPVTLVIERLQGDRSQLLEEIHVLASRYHWSLAEILSLSPRTRQEFLALISEGAE